MNSAESSSPAAKIESVIACATSMLERDEAMRACLLALVSGESIFLLGKPGTAKSLLALWISSAIQNAKRFSCLLNQYTQPDELFGPLSIEKLGEGKREILSEGYLPDANVAFLDELFKAGPAILNSLLTILNERIFRNGNQEKKVPLCLLLGASNELPDEDSGLDALYDRFLIRVEVRPIQNAQAFKNLVSQSQKINISPTSLITFDEINSWKEKSEQIDFPDEISAYLFSLRLRLNEQGIYISDRRWAKTGKLLKVSAFINSRQKVSFQDLLILGNVLWSSLEEKTDIAECARNAIFPKVVCNSFSFVERIQKETDVFSTKEIFDESAFKVFDEDVKKSLDYLAKLSAELENAKSGNANFWRNVFCSLETPFERMMMAEGIAKLLEFVGESEQKLESLRFSKRPKINKALNVVTPTVILRAADEAISAASAASPSKTSLQKAISATKSQNPAESQSEKSPIPPISSDSSEEKFEVESTQNSDKEAIAALLKPLPQKRTTIGGFFKSIFGSDSEKTEITQKSPESPESPNQKQENTATIVLTPKSQESKNEIEILPNDENWQETLTQIKTFDDFVRFSAFQYNGDASDPRYRWNENRNNGQKWWNVGSRFNRAFEDRSAIFAIEAECAKRGAGFKGKYHWIYAVCYIFEKNDGYFNERTKAELAWLSGSAWSILEAALTEALS